MLKKLLSDTVIYGLTTVLMKLINYALTPLHTAVFGPTSFGIVSLFYTYAVLFNVLYTYGMETAFFRFATKKDKKEVYSNIQSSLFITSFILSSALWFSAPYVETLFGYEDSEMYVKLFSILFAVDTIIAIPFASLRIDGKAKRFAFLKMSEVVLTFGLNYFFLVTCMEVVEGKSTSIFSNLILEYFDPSFGRGYVFLANLISKAFVMFLLLDKFLEIKFSWSWEKMKPYYKYGFPLIFSGVAFFINEASDRTLLTILIPDDFYSFGDAEAAMGIYSANYRLSIFITLAVTAYKYAAEPFFFSTAESKNSPQIFAKVMHYFVITLMIMVVGVVSNLSWIAPIVLKQDVYFVGLPVVPILLMANVFLGMYYNLSVWFKVTDKTSYGARISAIGAVVTLSMNFLLIPYIGFYGSAIATFCCYFTMMAYSYYLGQKYYPIPYNVKMVFVYFFVGGMFIVINTFVKINGFWLNIFVQNTMFVLFLLFIVYKEKELVNSLLHKLSNRI
ncbi:lipopolysaccharide biosynthesis protein [Flammeovirga sp. EKP202]|uniref:lipopolysaccharide biosynthesis protein n=1 Tax=Flammeovirga sp. EKP202 TaxID=2770592 RepID=UPI00165EE232|nr:polysaccharide biosynthesis C-terminal domain-containing protein [Flammeovirga sp. EKP202]MBD0402164.1 polysaccharide biosynthesis C-terminal domain-containing protein [Flammeovirga sp. EKP202]